MKKVIITIGREFGSGGREIGIKLSEKLGLPFYDKELIVQTAKNSNIEPQIIERYDEQHAFPSFSSSNIFDIYQMPMSDRVYIAQADAIRDLAEKGGCIIEGRCADFILKDDPALVSVFISAPIKDKIERKRLVLPNMSDSELENHIRKIDKKRGKYYTYYTDRVWGGASTYDLCINSSILGIDGTVNLIIDAVNMRK